MFGFDGAAGVGVINGQNQSFTDNFDNGNYDANLWSSVTGYPSWGCGSYSGSYALYFTNSGTRSATTNPLGISGGSQVSFI